MSCGLVLEGGAMRGMFTAGVLDVFMENEIAFEKAVGVSAGAVFGCNLKSRQIGRAIRYNKRFAHDPRYASFLSLLLTGDLYNGQFCYHTVPDKLDPFDRETFAKDPTQFYVVATDVRSGEAVYKLCKDGGEEDLLWMRASASMPFFAKPVQIDGRTYLDGGIADSIPIRFMEGIGCERNVVILTQPSSYRKRPVEHQQLVNLALKDMPAIVKQLERRCASYNDTVDYISCREADGVAFVIRPDEALRIGKIEKDPRKLEEVYQIGRRAALDQLDALRAFLEGE